MTVETVNRWRAAVQYYEDCGFDAGQKIELKVPLGKIAEATPPLKSHEEKLGILARRLRESQNSVATADMSIFENDSRYEGLSPEERMYGLAYASTVVHVRYLDELRVFAQEKNMPYGADLIQACIEKQKSDFAPFQEKFSGDLLEAQAIAEEAFGRKYASENLELAQKHV